MRAIAGGTDDIASSERAAVWAPDERSHQATEAIDKSILALPERAGITSNQ